MPISFRISTWLVGLVLLCLLTSCAENKEKQFETALKAAEKGRNVRQLYTLLKTHPEFQARTRQVLKTYYTLAQQKLEQSPAEAKIKTALSQILTDLEKQQTTVVRVSFSRDDYRETQRKADADARERVNAQNQADTSGTSPYKYHQIQIELQMLADAETFFCQTVSDELQKFFESNVIEFERATDTVRPVNSEVKLHYQIKWTGDLYKFDSTPPDTSFHVYPGLEVENKIDLIAAGNQVTFQSKEKSSSTFQVETDSVKAAQSPPDPSKVYLTMFSNAFIESGKHYANFLSGAETKMK
ncbi:MAG TPA: hypothetical protein PLS70_11525 [Acidobacteriota bacterium]|nr:hypothetical protein [Acidobacteriota bacterium]